MTAQKNEMSMCIKEVHDWCRKCMILDMVLIHFLIDFPYKSFNRFHHDKLDISYVECKNGKYMYWTNEYECKGKIPFIDE